ncbi:cell division protein ZapA [candidate division KSB1 bacterium]|nr:cell division protein ZapA [candidate division KSB1 bacterium]RQW01418.1 MAG: cell division protein ZapA [candidate division KSB1 bacterium]
MEIEKKNVKVNIFGSEYTLRSNAADNGDVYNIAEYVDGKMREIQAAKPSRPLHQIAILAALNITGELFQLRQQGTEEFKDLQTKIIKLADKLELGIQEKSEDSPTRI